MTKLQELGMLYQTDKRDENHSFFGRSYLDDYNDLFAPLASTTKHFLELGVGFGGSVKMWRDFFPFSTIWGVDINKRCENYSEHRIKIIIGDQKNPEALSLVATGEKIDIILDDCSHIILDAIASFNLLWGRVSPGGYYIIEDTGMFYGCLGVNKREDFDDFLSNQVHKIDQRIGDMQSILLLGYRCVMKKANLQSQYNIKEYDSDSEIHNDDQLVVSRACSIPR